MKIGLVLASLPGYSETFFRNKIKGLQESGVEVVLFINANTNKREYLVCKTIIAPVFSFKKPVRTVCNSIIQIVTAVFINPIRSYKLFRAERQSGKHLSQCLTSVIINQFLLRERLDWLHFGFGTMALGRENVAAVIEAKMAVSFRGFDIGIYPIKHPGCYQLMFKSVDKIHVISNDLKELLFKHGLSNNIPVIKITPAIDVNFFTRNQPFTTNSKIKFLTIGRLHWKKGFEHTLKALSHLKDQGFEFQYTIIGEGEERERLIFSAHQLGILEYVSFVGKLTPQEVKQQLENTDLYLQYSLQEGFCNAVLEAQVMGTLCVVSDAEGLSENVLDKFTGWVVPKRDPVSLADQIKEIIGLPNEIKENIRQQAIARVKKQFNLTKQKQEFLRFYNIERA